MGKLIIATVAGDLHDIGKNLVAMMIESAGFEVIDLGVDVPIEKIIECYKSKPRYKDCMPVRTADNNNAVHERHRSSAERIRLQKQHQDHGRRSTYHTGIC